MAARWNSAIISHVLSIRQTFNNSDRMTWTDALTSIDVAMVTLSFLDMVIHQLSCIY